jgi:hypothetical protein
MSGGVQIQGMLLLKHRRTDLITALRIEPTVSSTSNSKATVYESTLTKPYTSLKKRKKTHRLPPLKASNRISFRPKQFRQRMILNSRAAGNLQKHQPDHIRAVSTHRGKWVGNRTRLGLTCPVRSPPGTGCTACTSLGSPADSSG